MSSEVQVVAIITPAPGKEARVKELLVGLGENVKAHESDVARYEIYEQYNGENGNVFVVEEIYKNQAAYEAHFKTDYFQALGKLLPEEKVLAGPLDIKTIRPIGGFASR